ncbi:MULTISPECIES: EFR1 family ferrodoxin [unclassified Methanoregula]|uniref:EFR1 family ferrodoxin n=1 Tax=unclassified Methanoregula TaxID=2649730 RepID=UPI0009D15C69|nr:MULTISPECIES: EFR1 family ferrodoxin [unclassified Methanoregula]OPX62853.1 MAG: ferredoxin [Methanoregula sp. PtaB.Bin085]OPY35290.1 MAG: ferredoxin [Methanoregula sp. PtaU1.Bin006]
MKTVIYYFTGTGNTLAIVRDLAAELGDSELVPVPEMMRRQEIACDADAVGIAFPVYFLDLPEIVEGFVRKLRFTGRSYIFGIATCGERPGGALFSLQALLEEKGQALASGFVFVMPENFIGPVDLMGDAPHRQDKYAAARGRIAPVAAMIRERKQSLPEGNPSAILRIGGKITRSLATTLYNTPRHLRATCRCNHCRTCERICPARNIVVEKDAVIFGNSCTQCYACIHWCPQGAIEIGRRTAGKPRYHHPDVTLADMLRQRGDA